LQYSEKLATGEHYSTYYCERVFKMFYWSLFFRLLIRTFSLRRTSLRFPSPRRIIASMIVLPFLLLQILFNRFFMLLDWIFFPHFSREKIEKPLFIIGVPRSATTYLLEVMSRDQNNFTCFKLWEILFAPSILQKYFWRAIIALDKLIGRPLYRLSKIYDRVVLGKITKIHKTGMTSPEEDEMLLLYCFSSMYIIFFFPDVKVTDELIFFDQLFPERKRKRVMKFYRRCVQRHMFVFGNNGRRTFLSKNPCFISKMESVADEFPDAKLLYMLRSPERTIPSTISMNSNIYSIICNGKQAHVMHERTRDAVITWYRNADRALSSHWKNRHFVVHFNSITKQPKATLEAIYSFVGIDPGAEMRAQMQREQDKVATYSTEHSYNPKAGIDEDLIRKELSGLNVGFQ
jgi:omega-hydroxy-beta-dihydromenaquinone-9 sulfotransferase